jgi:uncharacterized membrane protein (DUF2068 family)
MQTGDAACEPSPNEHLGLHLIAVFEGLKGLLALAAAVGLALLGPQPLRHAVSDLISRFHLNPDHGVLPGLLNAINPGAVHLAVIILLIYALMRLLEAWGLWRTRVWASWLGCLGSAAYLPLDLYALYHHHGWHTWAVLIANLVIVAVLGRDILKRRAVERPRI